MSIVKHLSTFGLVVIVLVLMTMIEYDTVHLLSDESDIRQTIAERIVIWGMAFFSGLVYF